MSIGRSTISGLSDAGSNDLKLIAYGGAAELLSLVSLLLVNLILPTMVAADRYGEFVELQSVVFVPLALINGPANVHFLAAHHRPDLNLMPMLAAKHLATVAAVIVVAALIGVGSAAAATAVLALGACALTMAQHLGLAARQGSYTLQTAIVGAFGAAFVPIVGLTILDLSPATVIGVSGLTFVTSSAWFFRRTPLLLTFERSRDSFRSGLRELLSAIGHVGPSSYVSTVAGWVLVLAVAATADSESVASAKLAVSVAYIAVLIVPLSSSIVMSGTAQNDRGRQFLSRVGLGIIVIGSLGGVIVVFGRTNLLAPYTTRFDLLGDLLIYSSALMVPVALNSVLFGLLFRDPVLRPASRIVAALGIACLCCLSLPSLGTETRFLIFCIFAYASALVTTLALELRVVAALVVGAGLGWSIVGRYV